MTWYIYDHVYLFQYRVHIGKEENRYMDMDVSFKLFVVKLECQILY